MVSMRTVCVLCIAVIYGRIDYPFLFFLSFFLAGREWLCTIRQCLRLHCTLSTLYEYAEVPFPFLFLFPQLSFSPSFPFQVPCRLECLAWNWNTRARVYECTVLYCTM